MSAKPMSLGARIYCGSMLLVLAGFLAGVVMCLRNWVIDARYSDMITAQAAQAEVRQAEAVSDIQDLHVKTQMVAWQLRMESCLEIYAGTFFGLLLSQPLDQSYQSTMRNIDLPSKPTPHIAEEIVEGAQKTCAAQLLDQVAMTSPEAARALLGAAEQAGYPVPDAYKGLAINNPGALAVAALF